MSRKESSQEVLQRYLDELLQSTTLSTARLATLPDELTGQVLQAALPCAGHPNQPAGLHRTEIAADPDESHRLSTLLPVSVPTVPLTTPRQLAREGSVGPEGAACARPYDLQKAWDSGSIECLLFDVAGLTMAAPLMGLSSIHPLAGRDLTPLFGQAEWFLGLLPVPSATLKVVETARWVMPERYQPESRSGLRYVLALEGCDWGLAVHQVSRSIRLDVQAVKWRSQRGRRPWLAGTVIEEMCALLDVAALADLLNSQGARIVD